MKLFVLLLTSLFTFPLLSQDLNNETIYKKVKEMKIDVFQASIDSNSNEIIEGSRKSGYKSKTYIKYSKKGNESERYYNYNEGSFFLGDLSFYNKKNQLDSSATFVKESQFPSSWSLFTYDQKKRLTITTQIEDDLRQRSKEEKTYDQKGNLIKLDSYYWEELEFTKAFTYDKKGNKTSENYTYPDEENSGNKTVFEYDERGNMIKETYSNQKITFWIKHTYNDQNLCIEQCNNRNMDSCQVTRQWSYDHNGNVIQQRVLANANTENEFWSVSQMEYEYDKKKNWIRKTIFVNEIPTYIVVRSLTY